MSESQVYIEEVELAKLERARYHIPPELNEKTVAYLLMRDTKEGRCVTAVSSCFVIEGAPTTDQLSEVQSNFVSSMEQGDKTSDVSSVQYTLMLFMPTSKALRMSHTTRAPDGIGHQAMMHDVFAAVAKAGLTAASESNVDLPEWVTVEMNANGGKPIAGEDVNTVNMEEFFMRCSAAEQNAYLKKLTPEEKKILIQRRDAWEDEYAAVLAAKDEAQWQKQYDQKQSAIGYITSEILDEVRAMEIDQCASLQRKYTQEKLDLGAPLSDADRAAQSKYALQAKPAVVSEALPYIRAAAEKEHQQKDKAQRMAGREPFPHQDIVDRTIAFLVKEVPNAITNMEDLFDRAMLSGVPEVMANPMLIVRPIPQADIKKIRNYIAERVDRKMDYAPDAFDPEDMPEQYQKKNAEDIRRRIAKKKVYSA